MQLFCCFDRLEIFLFVSVVQSSWEILVFLLAYLIPVIDNGRGIHLLGHHAGTVFIYFHNFYMACINFYSSYMKYGSASLEPMEA